MARYYFINSQGAQIGPVERDDMLRFGIKRDTLVWREGAPAWIAADKEPDLASHFATVPPPPPPPVPPTPPTQASAYRPAQPSASAWQTGRTATNTPPYASAPSSAAEGRPFAEKPSSYMWLGIFTILLGFLPFSIVSIVYASKVDRNWAVGDYDAAYANSTKAKSWGIASVSVALFFILMVIISLATG